MIVMRFGRIWQETRRLFVLGSGFLASEALEQAELREALQKALRSLEINRFGLCGDGNEKRVDPETLALKLSVPNAERIFYVAQAFEDGMTIDQVYELTKIDRWFLRNLQQIVEELSLFCVGRSVKVLALQL